MLNCALEICLVTTMLQQLNWLGLESSGFKSPFSHEVYWVTLSQSIVSQHILTHRAKDAKIENNVCCPKLSGERQDKKAICITLITILT